MSSKNYELSNELIEEGYISDDSGIYVPYPIKNEVYHDPRDIYLKISRRNDGEYKILYTFVKLEEGLFYPLESFRSPELLSCLDKKLKRTMSFKGRLCNLNSRKGSYVDFADSFLDNICNADCLDILKVDDFSIKTHPNDINLTMHGEKCSNHNLIDMRDLVKLTTGNEPAYSYPKKGYDMFVCPFHDDHKASAHVHKHAFGCFKNNKWQLDQTAFLKLFYGLETNQEVEIKFQELIHQ